MVKLILFIILLFPVCSSAGIVPKGGDVNGSSNPSAYYYFDADTYYYFNGDQVFLYINGVLTATWGTAAEQRTIWYSGRQLIYGGRVLSR